MTKDDFMATVTPALLNFLAVAIPALLLWIGTLIRSWTNKQAEATDRQALHSAMETGTAAAEKKFSGTNAPASEKAAYAVNYAEKSVPDAIKNLKPTSEVMAKLAMAKQENLSNAQNPPC